MAFTCHGSLLTGAGCWGRIHAASRHVRRRGLSQYRVEVAVSVSPIPSRPIWAHRRLDVRVMIADAVRYMSVDSYRDPDSAGLSWTTLPIERLARERENAQATGRFRWWWQVLGSNQRRLSRRFYRPFP
jgi:hypothetical protein